MLMVDVAFSVYDYIAVQTEALKMLRRRKCSEDRPAQVRLSNGGVCTLGWDQMRLLDVQSPAELKRRQLAAPGGKLSGPRRSGVRFALSPQVRAG